MIGSVAVIPGTHPTRGTRQYQLGAMSHHMVYEGEAVGLLLALELIKINRIDHHTIILLDNQAVIQALTLRKHSPSHYLIDLFHLQLAELTKQAQHANLTLQIAWVQGHTRVQGNEEADREAKRAAEGQHSQTSPLPKGLRNKLPYSVAAVRQAFQSKTKARILSDFAASPRFPKLHEIDPSVPSSGFRKMMEIHSRKINSIMTQLHTGHAPLNKHLHTCNGSDYCVHKC